MIVADFHVHSTFSVDGMSTMEQHCIAAIQKGIKKICFTEHVDYNIAEYNVGKVKDVYCKIKLPKVAKQKWTLLQVQIGQSCKGCI